MLHELIDFLLLGSILPSHSVHELFHPGDIGLGNGMRLATARLLTCDIHDALAIVGCWRNREKHGGSHY